MNRLYEHTLGMIKPEGIPHKDDLYSRIYSQGLAILKKEERILKEKTFLHLYGNVAKKAPEIYPSLKEHMLEKPLELLIIAGDDAINTLIALRGASNPAEALPGTIRGDYASDQDRKILNPQGKLALTYFHACDDTDEVRKYRTLFKI